MKVIQEGRKIRIVVAAVEERLTEAFGWQVGDEVFKGEVGVPRPVSGGTFWPITGQLHYRYNRFAKPKLPNLSDFWAESAGEFHVRSSREDYSLKIYGRDGAQDRLPYETSGKGYQEKSWPYEFSRYQPETKPGEPGSAKVAELKFVRKTEKGFEPVKDQTLRYGGQFAIEAKMDSDTKPEDRKRSGKLNWGKGPDKEKPIDFYRESARIFRSEIFRLEPTPPETKTPPAKVPPVEVRP